MNDLAERVQATIIVEVLVFAVSSTDINSPGVNWQLENLEPRFYDAGLTALSHTGYKQHCGLGVRACSHSLG